MSVKQEPEAPATTRTQVLQDIRDALARALDDVSVRDASSHGEIEVELAWSGRVETLAVKGTITVGEDALFLTMSAAAERDPGQLLLYWVDSPAARGLKTGDDDFDRSSHLEAAPRDLALAFLDAGLRAALHSSRTHGPYSLDVERGRVTLRWVLDSEEWGRYPELDERLAEALALLHDAVARLPGLLAQVDAGLAAAAGDPYRGGGAADELRARQLDRDAERRALRTRRRIRGWLFATTGLFVVGALLVGLLLLIRSCG